LGVTPSGSYQLQTQSNFTAGSKGFSLSSFSGGASGNGIPFVGYNLVTTSTASSYKYNQTDVASAISFYDGVKFYVAASGTAGNAITFTQAMTLTAAGTLLVGKTTAGDTVLGSQIGSDGYITATRSDSTNANTTYHVYSTAVSNYRFYVGMGGTVFATNTTISSLSDQRHKENIRDLNVGLSEVMALKPRLFDWKEGKGADIKNARGFIAQEFETVFPDLIDTWKEEPPEGEDPYKSVRADLIPVLVKAIQEQQALITSLTARITALEA
jgi:hypothetical protein